MRGGALTPALIFMALGLALSCSPRNERLPGLVALLATLGILIFLSVPGVWSNAIFLSCWLTVIITAASVHFFFRRWRGTTYALAINAGVWASAVVSLSGSRLDLLKALPLVLIFIPASWTVVRYSAIPVKVASSWIIAIAVLAITLQLIPVTPGYLPDHME
jgi:hypothetical protein